VNLVNDRDRSVPAVSVAGAAMAILFLQRCVAVGLLVLRHRRERGARCRVPIVLDPLLPSMIRGPPKMLTHFGSPASRAVGAAPAASLTVRRMIEGEGVIYNMLTHRGDTMMNASPTARAIDAMATYGRRPFEDEVDHRPMPDDDASVGAITEMMEILAGTLVGTRMEDDLEDLLWHMVNVYHRAAGRVAMELDKNELAQRDAQQRQDGSEVAAVELERLIDEGRTMVERLAWYERSRDHGAELFAQHTGSDWRPRTGSMVNRRHLTAALLDSRDFLAARRQTEREVHLPTGPRIFIAGGDDVEKVEPVWDMLDKIRTKHPSMVLMTCGVDKGAQKIASIWARNRGITVVAFKPDWRLGNKAGFKRNEQLLDTMPIGGIVFKGSGIVDNLADRARAMGIPVMDMRNAA